MTEPAKRKLIWIAWILAIPIIPFLLIGWYLEPQIEAFVSGPWPKTHAAVASLVTIGLLISDIFLPIPSSAVCTFSGALFGFGGGALVNWLGLTIGAALGLEAGRLFTNKHPAGKENRTAAETKFSQILDQFGIWGLAICRGVPVLAEASVLAAGVYRLDRLRCWIAIALSNAALAIAYGLLGEQAAASNWLVIGLALSLALPLLALLTLANWFSTKMRKRYD